MQNFNQSLHRPLQSGNAYTQLISSPSGSAIDMGVGNTHHSTAAMKRLISSHFLQVEKLAQKLKGSDLKETCNNIYEFIYNHIQYKQDEALQQLRTPANSWKNRNEGIDCKSYSIFAGCLLSCLGIKYYIRQIKQALFNPQQFSHVYIVVPFDQETANINTAYYCIDGTVKSNREPLFTQKHDLYMPLLKHVGLNGAKARKTTRKPATTRKTTRKTTKKSGLMGLMGSLAAGVGLGMLISK